MIRFSPSTSALPLRHFLSHVHARTLTQARVLELLRRHATSSKGPSHEPSAHEPPGQEFHDSEGIGVSAFTCGFTTGPGRVSVHQVLYMRRIKMRVCMCVCHIVRVLFALDSDASVTAACACTHACAELFVRILLKTNSSVVTVVYNFSVERDSEREKKLIRYI
jgi:hypothetical protein